MQAIWRKGKLVLKKYDMIIIGSGLAGLNVAYFALKNGMKVLVLEQDQNGSGASGGLVGALAPHMPENWNEKKQYQLDAMQMAGEFWSEIECVSGFKTGYAKNGRLQKILDESSFHKAKMRENASKMTWKDIGYWRVLNDNNHPFASASFGYVIDNLSAQIMPRDAIIALGVAVKKMGAEILENFKVEEFSPHFVSGKNGQSFHAEHIVIAAGFHSWSWARKYLGADFGEGTKGQAAIMRIKSDWQFPMITGDGYYIVPHSKREIAVGSTSERYWKSFGIDEKLTALLDSVKADCPILQEAEIIDTWSGIRPRAYRPDPLIGKLENGIFINCGGFKTGFSFAPKLGEDLVKIIMGQSVNIPDGFMPKVLSDKQI